MLLVAVDAWREPPVCSRTVLGPFVEHGPCMHATGQLAT